MPSTNAGIDQNSRQTLTALSSVDGETIVPLYADPTTHALLVDASGLSITVYTETPSGVIDGVNATFTTAQNIGSILSFNINGQFIHPYLANPEAGANYTFTGSTITFTSPLDASYSGLPFTIVYI